MQAINTIILISFWITTCHIKFLFDLQKNQKGFVSDIWGQDGMFPSPDVQDMQGCTKLFSLASSQGWVSRYSPSTPETYSASKAVGLMEELSFCSSL